MVINYVIILNNKHNNCKVTLVNLIKQSVLNCSVLRWWIYLFVFFQGSLYEVITLKVCAMSPSFAACYRIMFIHQFTVQPLSALLHLEICNSDIVMDCRLYCNGQSNLILMKYYSCTSMDLSTEKNNFLGSVFNYLWFMKCFRMALQ